MGISTVGRLLGTILLSVAGNSARNRENGALFIVLGISAVVVALVLFYRDKWLALLRHRKKRHTPSRE
jgi:uncharacterized membrane protein YdjX (TVP38/TMEM64 family)